MAVIPRGLFFFYAYKLASVGFLPTCFTTARTWACLISCTYDWPSGEEAVIILPSTTRLRAYVE